MRSDMQHVIKVVAATGRGNAALALGKLKDDTDDFTVPLSATGLAPATHFAQSAWESPELAADVDAVKGGQRLKGITTAEQAAIKDVVSSRQPRLVNGEWVQDYASPRAHFDAVLEARGLREIAA